jgi:hypothetical protein
MRFSFEEIKLILKYSTLRREDNSQENADTVHFSGSA